MGVELCRLPVRGQLIPVWIKKDRDMKELVECDGRLSSQGLGYKNSGSPRRVAPTFFLGFILENESSISALSPIC